MKLQDATLFITGANRGLGLAFARHALAHGARKVYAAARDPAQTVLPGLVPIALDVNDAAQVAAAARDCGDVDLVVNNAGIAHVGGLLACNGGGALLNVLSVSSWVSAPVLAAYAVSKAAAWSVTNGLRNELRGAGTQVLALHVGFIDTGLTRGFDAPKLAPELVAARAFEALERGDSEVAIDELTQQVKAGLSRQPGIDINAAR